MAKIFFRLRNVPEDEANDVRQILDDSSIPWFETSAGRWGISFPAIWLRDDGDLQRARELLDQYQVERSLRFKMESAERQQRGEQETVVSQFFRKPLRSILAAMFIIVVVYFSISPFLSMYKTL